MFPVNILSAYCSAFITQVHPHVLPIQTRPLAPLTTPTNPPTTSGSQGVVSFTVNCSIHLHPDAVVSSEVERSNSKTDLKNLRGPQYTNACPSDVTMVTGLNGEGHASVHPLMITDHHSTITVSFGLPVDLVVDN